MNQYLGWVGGVLLLIIVAVLAGMGLIAPDDKDTLMGVIVGGSAGVAGGYVWGRSRAGTDEPIS